MLDGLQKQNKIKFVYWNCFLLEICKDRILHFLFTLFEITKIQVKRMFVKNMGKIFDFF